MLLISLDSGYTRRPAFYRQYIAAFGDLPGWHVVLQIGNDLVTDAQVAHRSTRLRADALAEGGTPHAADLIENMLT